MGNDVINIVTSDDMENKPLCFFSHMATPLIRLDFCSPLVRELTELHCIVEL